MKLSSRFHFPLAFAAGLGGGFAFAPWDLWPLMIGSLTVLLLLLERRPTRKGAFAVAWWWGFGNFLIGQHWIAQAFQFQAKMPAALGWVAVVGLSMLMAVYPAITGAVAQRFRRSMPARILAFAALWMLTEWLRGYLLSGFGWNPLGVTALPIGGLAQAAALIGALGLSGLVALLAGGIALMLSGHLRFGAALAVPILLAALPPWAGETRLTETRLHIVQANIGQDEKYGEDQIAAAVRRYGQLSPPPGGGPRLLIWPEAAIPDLLDELPRTRRQIAGLLAPDDLLLLGGLKAIRDDQGYAIAAYNSLYVIDPDGDILDRYDKTKLVPFGEFLPLRGFMEAIGIARLAPGALDFWPGVGPRTLDLPGFPDVGAMICYEVIYAGAADPALRPHWLLNVSNDAWFSDVGAHMHLAQARLRSIEQGLPMARSTPTGISAIIDPYGRVLDSIGRREAGVLAARLPESRAPTLFSRTGETLPLIAAIMLLVAAFAVGRKRT